MKVYIPKEIAIVGSSLTCTGVHGVDSKNLTCITNLTERSINITNAFTIREVAPSNITFTI